MNDCIEWPGRVNYRGIPIDRCDGSSRRSARQLIYAENFGPTGGLPVTTTCGRSNCVNPQHLSLVRALTTHCANGHKYTKSTTRWRVRTDKGETVPTRDCLVCKKVSEGKRRDRLRISERTYV